MEVTLKQTNPNPKDSVSVGKVPLSAVPANVLLEVGLAMLEGARKYGKYNYRIAGVRSSVYYDATLRHLIDWHEGTDIDPDSGLNHLSKAIASLIVIRDAQMQGKMIDDRPPRSGFNMQEFNEKAKEIIKRIPEAKEPFTQEGVNQGLYK